MAQKELQYATNSDGERIIPGSRRADGSLRPERRIREGYVPQEDRPLYQSRSALERRGVTICPGEPGKITSRMSTDPMMRAGANFVDEHESKPAPSKSAKKRRNKKKNTSAPAGGEDKAIHEARCRLEVTSLTESVCLDGELGYQ